MATAVPPVEFLDSRKIFWVAAVVAPGSQLGRDGGLSQGFALFARHRELQSVVRELRQFRQPRADCLA